MSRPYNRDGQLISRSAFALTEKNAGRVMDFAEQAGVIFVRIGEHIDAVLGGELKLGLGIEIVMGWRHASGDFRADAIDGLQFAAGGVPHSGRRAEAFEQCLGNAGRRLGPAPAARDRRVRPQRR